MASLGMPPSRVIVLANGLRERLSASGKLKFSIAIESEPLIHNLNPKLLGAGPANAIAEVLRERITSIKQEAAPATQRFRAEANRAFGKGAHWANKRYGGGRIGDMRPERSPALFNDSGRFAKSLVATANKEGWGVNVAANRLSGPDAQKIYARLVDLVPEFAHPGKLMDDLRVRRAIQEGERAMLTKGPSSEDELSAERARLIAERNKMVLELFKKFAELAG